MLNAEESSQDSVAFGPFRVHKRRRLLLEGDKEVRLGSRAFDLLVALPDHGGEVVMTSACAAAVQEPTSPANADWSSIDRLVSGTAPGAACLKAVSVPAYAPA